MSLARTFLLASSWSKYRAYCRDLAAPERAQARVWQSTWAQVHKAPFWQERMGRTRAAPALSGFPLTTYDDYQPALEASFAAPISRLSGDPIRFWSVSAGSTGPRKVFPITDAYRRQFQTTTPPFLHQLAGRHDGMLGKPILYFAGSTPSERSPAGVEVGFISNFNYRNIPGFLRRLYAFPEAALADAATFKRWGPLYALATDLSAMVGITPAIMVKFFRGIEDRADEYLAALEGKLSPPAPLPAIRPASDRADRLRRALAGGRLQFRELWPSLQFVCCWKASTCGMQLPALREHTGDIPLVDATYSATEAWINVPFADGRVGGPVHPGAHVVEFLPLGASDASALVPLHEVEPGRDYEIVVTTAMGLIRYRLFDRIRCTGREARTPIIEFVQKSSSEISLGPACVSEAELAGALAALGLEPADDRVFAPAPTGDRIELIVTSDTVPPDGQELERALCAQNPMYAKYVAEGALAPLAVRTVAPSHPAIARDMHAQSKPRLLRKDPVEAS